MRLPVIYQVFARPLLRVTKPGDNPVSLDAPLAFWGVYGTNVSAGTWDMIATTAVPAPESYAMLLAGLGLLGFVARRSKRTTA